MNTLVHKMQNIPSVLLGNKPVVVLPLHDFEEIMEDLEMYASKPFASKIARSRKSTLHSLTDVKRKLGIK